MVTPIITPPIATPPASTSAMTKPLVTPFVVSAALASLKRVINSYTPLSEDTWLSLQQCCSVYALDKDEVLYPYNTLLDSFAFVYTGLLRVYTADEKGHEYNKVFFDEGTFPGVMAALLTNSRSEFALDALEPSIVVKINFAAYRKLLIEVEDLKLYHILYLEKNWLLAKEAREIQMVQENATQRYLRFLSDYPDLTNRLSQYHIASHLGISPTQLSRIRKQL